MVLIYKKKCLQGKEELVRHFESVGFPCESDQVLPVLFEPPRDGSRKLVKQSIVGKCTRMEVFWEALGIIQI